MKYPDLKKQRIQCQLIIIAVYNIALNLIPLYLLKRCFLRLTGSHIGPGVALHVPTYMTRPGRLSIGAGSTINFGCYLDTRGVIAIGDNVMIGHRCRIYTAGHRIGDPHFGGYHAPVHVGAHAVLFPNSLIMPGVNIGTGAVVLPGSVVTKDIGPYEIAGGNPASVVGTRPAALNYRHDYNLWFTNA